MSIINIEDNLKRFKSELNPIHCSRCGRFIGYEMLLLGVVQILCPKCKTFNEIINVPEID